MSLPKGFREWLVSETAAWSSDGLIEKEQRERILARYPETPAETGALAFALRTLGVLLFGAAILLVISHNWAEFGRAGQLTTVFGALALIQGVALWCFHAGHERGAVIGHLLGCIMYGAGIALIGQIYHLDAHAPDAVLAWCVFTIPFAVLLDATVLHLFTIGLAGSWLLMEADGGGWWWQRQQLHHGARLVFALLLVPSALAAYRRARPALAGTLAWSCLFLWFLFMGRIPVHIFVLPLVLAALHATGDARGRGFRFIGAGGVAFITLALGSLHRSTYRDFGESFLRHDPLYTLGTAALAGWAIHRARARQDSHAAWLGLIALLTLALGFLGALDLRGFRERETLWVLITAIANVTTLLLAVALIRQGLAENRLRPYVYGAIVFLAWLFWRYADIEKELGYLGMAGIFLLLGAVLFVLAKIWRQPREPAIVEAMPEFRPARLETVLAQLRPFRRQLLVGALALQFGVLGWMVYAHSRPLSAGERFLLRCEPVDPRSLTRGDYVILSYGYQSFSQAQYEGLMKEWHQLHPTDITEEKQVLVAAPKAEFIARRFFENTIPQDTVIYIPLRKGADGIADFGDPSLLEPTSGPFLLTRKGDGSWAWRNSDVRAGIESYYVAEGTGRKWEELRNRGQLLAEIGVMPDGKAGLISLQATDKATLRSLRHSTLDRYFTTLQDAQPLTKAIRSKTEFDATFHPAPLNGLSAIAPQFPRDLVLLHTLPETDVATTITFKDVGLRDGLLTAKVVVKRGGKQTYTLRPQAAIVVPSQGITTVEVTGEDGQEKLLELKLR